jgi:hypothetical protein
MVSVTFKGVGPGTCSWCGKEKNEVFKIETGDFKGDLCRLDLCCFLRLKAGRPERNAANSASPSARDDASGSRQP